MECALRRQVCAFAGSCFSVGGCGMHAPGGHVQQQEGVVIVMLAPRVVCGAES